MGGKKDKEEAEEEEEKLELWSADANDQLVRERGKCLAHDHHVAVVFKELEDCQKRVKGKSYTAETCHQEMKDLMEAVDHCVGDKAFLLLK
ncbi:cytochrome b-c1 complex subunit 6, mitochondrial-like [Leguminivora glycinivorella]|uniref:cytochrome b-c1 complex subunit 6, mitochondrial-like n=1 Tax=Leguminivora glycinivorella TaxID=1035111 RepID=UPI00200C3C4E|nr:cytochrome b-c1 complex subunit 6, mitochondrial-like [Leguminivora glycinivorella]